MDYLFSCVHSYSIEQLEELWKYLNTGFVSRLDPSLIRTERKLHHSLRRYYITHALTTQRKDKAIVLPPFFNNMRELTSCRNSLICTATSCAVILSGRIGMVGETTI